MGIYGLRSSATAARVQKSRQRLVNSRQVRDKQYTAQTREPSHTSRLTSGSRFGFSFRSDSHRRRRQAPARGRGTSLRGASCIREAAARGRQNTGWRQLTRRELRRLDCQEKKLQRHGRLASTRRNREARNTSKLEQSNTGAQLGYGVQARKMVAGGRWETLKLTPLQLRA